MVKKKDKIDMTKTPFYLSGRGNAKTLKQAIAFDKMIKRREFMHNLWMWMCLIIAILACLNAFRCMAYSRVIDMLKEDNEALKAEIKVLNEQKDRLENDARYCIELEQAQYNLNMDDPEKASHQGK